MVRPHRLSSSTLHPQVVLGQLAHPPICLEAVGPDNQAARFKVQAAAETIRAILALLINNIQVQAVVEAAEAKLIAPPQEANQTNNLPHLRLPILHSRPNPPLTEVLRPPHPHLVSRELSENEDELMDLE